MTKKIALVTGASQGIGAATARALAADGYHVIVHYGNGHDKAKKVIEDIYTVGGSAEAVGADLSNPDATFDLAEKVKALCSDKPSGNLDALILNAAVMPMSTLAGCTPETFDQIYNVNLRSPFFLLQQLSPLLSEGASVVMLSSVTAQRVTGGVTAYASMKAAIESLVRRAAVELGERWIRVNGVAPATTASETIKPWTDTEQGREATIAVQALKRVAQPEDIADAISLLCSDKARWITGAVIPVNGGAFL